MSRDQGEQAISVMRKIRAWRELVLGSDLKETPLAEIVLDDLRRFCHANASTACFDDENKLDALASAQLEGRRQVWLRIQGMLEITEHELGEMTEAEMETHDEFSKP